jgi:nitrous oxidase accessory protein NosD
MELRKQCQHCKCSTGFIETRNGQDCVFCDVCKRHQYNAPKSETVRFVVALLYARMQNDGTN